MPPPLRFIQFYFRQPISRFLAVFALLLIFAPGCGGGPPEDGNSPTLQVRGQIIEVVVRNIAQVETLRIRDESGREFTFTTDQAGDQAGDQTGGFVGFTPSHLKEHQLLGQTVLVSYVERDGLLVIVEIGD